MVCGGVSPLFRWSFLNDGQVRGDLEIHQQLSLILELEKTDNENSGKSLFEKIVVFFAQDLTLVIEFQCASCQLIGFLIAHGEKIPGVILNQGELLVPEFGLFHVVLVIEGPEGR